MILILFTITLSKIAFSKPAYFNELTSKLPGGVWVHRCQTCHGGSSGRGLNQFGLDYFRVFRTANTSSMTSQLPMTSEQKWETLFNLDSDKDGLSNENEILAGKNPGLKNLIE
ncbi:MAG: hypothetical protein ACK5V3_08810 [Bdellovibrionales bacterium]